MWREGFRMGQYKSHDFLRYVRVLLAALIATGHKRAHNGRRRCRRVRLAKRDFVPEHGIRMTMKPRILADHYPAVGRSIPIAPRGHSCPQHDSPTFRSLVDHTRPLSERPFGQLLASIALSAGRRAELTYLRRLVTTWGRPVLSNSGGHVNPPKS